MTWFITNIFSQCCTSDGLFTVKASMKIREREQSKISFLILYLLSICCIMWKVNHIVTGTSTLHTNRVKTLTKKTSTSHCSDQFCEHFQYLPALSLMWSQYFIVNYQLQAVSLQQVRFCESSTLSSTDNSYKGEAVGMMNSRRFWERTQLDFNLKNLIKFSI